MSLKTTSALDAFVFPTRREEAWRFTPIEKISGTPWKAASTETNPSVTLPTSPFLAEKPAARLVFVNGRLNVDLSIVPGDAAVTLNKTTEPEPAVLARQQRSNPFYALNAAMNLETITLAIAENTALDAPIEIIHLCVSENSPVMGFPRTHITAGKNSQATVVQAFFGRGPTPVTLNAVSLITVEANAALNHFTIGETEKNMHVMVSTASTLDKNARLTSHTWMLGGDLTRNEFVVELNGEGAETDVNGLYMASGRQAMDNHTSIDHRVPHTISRENFKGVLDGHAQAVFDGRITVQPDAQKIDSTQSNKNLLLSDTALVNTKPELKIFANDVKCKHGATVGQLSLESLFYLRSRGITEADARRLLIHAFASEMADAANHAGMRDALRSRIDAVFGAA